MKLQASLRFVSFFAVNLAPSLHAASVIQFATASLTVAENAGQATLTVQRANNLDVLVSVDFATADGTATNGLKYTAVSGTMSQRFQPFFDLYPLEVSTNLVDWEPVALLQGTNSATNELTFVDAQAVKGPMRFYRVPTNHYTAAYPKPTGPYPVGRIDRLVSDPTRRNRYGISTNGSFAITVWYPAAPAAGQRPARWFEEAEARDTSSASFWMFLDSGYGTLKWLDRLPYFWTYSFSDAPLTELSGSFPVVLFSPGLTGFRPYYAERLEGLASQGYVVVAVDHSDAYDIVWPDGSYASRNGFDETETVDFDKNRARDLVVVLDELTKWNQTDARFAGRLGLDKVGAMGMSAGGPIINFRKK